MRDHPAGPASLVNLDLGHLEWLEEDFSHTTTLGIVTVDVRGVPATRECGFSQFCQAMRADPVSRARCYSCDAHGGLQAAIDGKPHIYRCHTGLIDLSVPIILDGQYVGAILSGQVRVDRGADDPDFLTKHDLSWRTDPHLRELYEQIPTVPISKVRAAAQTLLTMSQDLTHRVSATKTLPLDLATASRELFDPSLTTLRQALRGDDLPAAIRAVTAHLDSLFAGSCAPLNWDRLDSYHRELYAFADRLGPLASLRLGEVIEQHKKRHPSLDRYTCQIHLESLLYILYDAGQKAKARPKPTISTLLNRIERYPARLWTLRDAATYLGVSTSHASKTFKAFTGQGFASYVSNKRIDRAKLMIATTDQPIVAIAKTLGLLPNYFSRVFKLSTGMSPTQYRAHKGGFT